MGIWQSIEPNRTIAVLPHPSYHPEWEGLAEELNAPLISGLPTSSVRLLTLEIRSRLTNCSATFAMNLEVHLTLTLHRWHKAQSVGIYAFMRDFSDAATAMYTTPIEHDHAYISTGVGDAWWLPFPRSGWES